MNIFTRGLATLLVLVSMASMAFGQHLNCLARNQIINLDILEDCEFSAENQEQLDACYESSYFVDEKKYFQLPLDSGSATQIEFQTLGEAFEIEFSYHEDEDLGDGVFEAGTPTKFIEAYNLINDGALVVCSMIGNASGCYSNQMEQEVPGVRARFSFQCNIVEDTDSAQ